MVETYQTVGDFVQAEAKKRGIAPDMLMNRVTTEPISSSFFHMGIDRSGLPDISASFDEQANTCAALVGVSSVVIDLGIISYAKISGTGVRVGESQAPDPFERVSRNP